MPVVPLCDVHPSFGKVTTLNRENTTEKKAQSIIKQNTPPKYLFMKQIF